MAWPSGGFWKLQKNESPFWYSHLLRYFCFLFVWFLIFVTWSFLNDILIILDTGLVILNLQQNCNLRVLSMSSCFIHSKHVRCQLCLCAVLGSVHIVTKKGIDAAVAYSRFPRIHGTLSWTHEQKWWLLFFVLFCLC